MSPMGKLSKYFAVVSVALLIVLAVSPMKDFFREWKGYQYTYNQLITKLPQRVKPAEIGIKQIWVQKFDRVDRCETCHLGLKEDALVNAKEPFVHIRASIMTSRNSDVRCAMAGREWQRIQGVGRECQILGSTNASQRLHRIVVRQMSQGRECSGSSRPQRRPQACAGIELRGMPQDRRVPETVGASSQRNRIQSKPGMARQLAQESETVLSRHKNAEFPSQR